MGSHPDVLVIGGGIIGLTSAYFLAKAGLSVEVIDKGEMGKEASWAGAGIIPPGNPAGAKTPIDKLRARSVSQFPRLSDELRTATGIDNGFRVCGGVEFLTPEDEYAVELWRGEGIRFEQVGQLEPGVLSPSGATPYMLPGCAQVRNPWHLRALIAACRHNGVELTPFTSGISADPVSGAFGENTNMEVVFNWQARNYLIAAGAWTGQVYLEPDYTISNIAPVRGQIVLFNPSRRLFSHVLMYGKRYLVPREDGRVLVGSTEEPEAGFDKSNTPEGVQGLIDFACSLVPELRNAPVEKTWAGLRPGTPDGLPYIGRVPGWDNVFVAAGHFRAGVQLSVGTAEVVRDLILGREPPVPVDAFRLDRVPDATARPAFRS
ncbi:MAG: FAD-dependent oxidoreductase [Gemmataceae bacterium]